MARKGYYTGKRIYVPQDNETYIIGKIVGNTGSGEDVYETLYPIGNHKVGELQVRFIKKYLK